VLVVPALHLTVCTFIQFHPADRSYQWLPMFIVDFPISLPLLFLGRLLPAFVVFGVIGTLWWYLVGAVIRHLYWKYESKPQ